MNSLAWDLIFFKQIFTGKAKSLLVPLVILGLHWYIILNLDSYTLSSLQNPSNLFSQFAFSEWQFKDRTIDLTFVSPNSKLSGRVLKALLFQGSHFFFFFFFLKQ